MKFRFALFALVAIAGVGGAEAAVRYEFVTTDPPRYFPFNTSYGSFTLTRGGYFSSFTGVSPASLDSCTVTQPVANSCSFMFFDPHTGPGGAYSTVQFGSESADGTYTASQFLFDAGALTTPGTHTTVVNRLNPFDVVATVNVSLVPEPAAWTMVLGGFALIGGVLRGRQRVRAPLL